MQKTFEDVFSNTSLSIGILRKNSLFRKWESEFLLNQFWEGDFQCLGIQFSYLWLVGNGRTVVIVVIIVPHSAIPY